jgi:flagellar protein FlaJ
MYQKKMKHITKIEEYLPTFLRDISEMSRAGLTLSRSVATVAKGEYGELSPEIKKMNDLMSWGVSFERSLLTFAYRMNTALIDRSVALITQASKAGGRVSQVLEAAARDSTEVKQLEREERVYDGVSRDHLHVLLCVPFRHSYAFNDLCAYYGNSRPGCYRFWRRRSVHGAFDPDLFIRVMFHASLVSGILQRACSRADGRRSYICRA